MEGFSYIAVCQTAEGFGKRSVVPNGIRRGGICPLEENSTFQGILPPERICLFFCLNKSKACFRLRVSA